MIMGLEASGANLTSDAAKAKILQDVMFERASTSGNGANDGASYTWNANPSKLKTQMKKTSCEKTCFSCGKAVHFVAKCPEKFSSRAKPQSTGLCSIFAIGDVQTGAWYFDSGATCHMARLNQKFALKKHQCSMP